MLVSTNISNTYSLLRLQAHFSCLKTQTLEIFKFMPTVHKTQYTILKVMLYHCAQSTGFTETTRDTRKGRA
jgi:hypothetical protein